MGSEKVAQSSEQEHTASFYTRDVFSCYRLCNIMLWMLESYRATLVRRKAAVSGELAPRWGSFIQSIPGMIAMVKRVKHR